MAPGLKGPFFFFFWKVSRDQRVYPHRDPICKLGYTIQWLKIEF